MCVPSLNEICENIFELLRTQVKTYGSGAMDVTPIYPQTCSKSLYLYPSVTRTVKFKLETYRSSLYHIQAIWSMGIVSEKKLLSGLVVSPKVIVLVYYTKDKRTW